MVKEEHSQSVNKALTDILQYWMEKTPDHESGGFYGKIANDNVVAPDAPKGSVLNARILWSFAAAYNHKPQPEYLETAGRAYHYIAEHFVDNNYGGVYWTVDAQGNPLDTKKQVYAIAFTIYAFSEYFIASGREVAKEHAVSLYHDLIQYSLDKEKGGYFEAFGPEWEPIQDLRLSDKDANEKKTMNTHLHVLEAFANLYRIWPDEELKDRITDLLSNFATHMIDADTFHLKLFFDEDWNSKSPLISYGHDIEAAWLLLEAAEIIEDQEWITRLKDIAVKMAYAAMEGIDEDGGMFYEKDPMANHLIKEKHWWVQAEAMIGFYNAWQISADPIFLAHFAKIWDYTRNHIIDRENGEWFWGISADGKVMTGEDKVGLWKCPYHNSRACIEILKRI